jgi:hypothetical protein
MPDMKDYFLSDAKFLKLDIPVPHEYMLKEAQALKDRFTEHRNYENSHKGWKGLTLYGLSENLHESWQDYGYKNAVEAAKNFVWTEAAKECPVTMDFLSNTFPCKRYGRVRFMLVEAGGWIGPHSDTKHKIIENINIPLSNPKECLWCWGDDEELYMEPGIAYAMNISYTHSIYNRSNEDRYHIIIARHDSTEEWKSLINSAASLANVTGTYITHEIAV